MAAVESDSILAELVQYVRHTGRRDLLAFESLVGARQYRPLHDLLRAWVPLGATVLDWGAGGGHFSFFLLRTGYRATGFGFTRPRLLENADSHAYCFVEGGLDEPVLLPFPDASFDAVCSVGVLEHVRETGGDEAASLAEIARLLVPGGVFVCYHLPNRTSWIEFVARRVPSMHHHRWRYDAPAIGDLVRGAGLELEVLKRYGLLPRNGWARLQGLGGSPRVADAWDHLDALGARLLPWICQNFLFVARKPVADLLRS